MYIEFQVVEVGMRRNKKKKFLQGLMKVKQMLQSRNRAPRPFSWPPGADIVYHIFARAVYNHRIAKVGRDIWRLCSPTSPPLN